MTEGEWQVCTDPTPMFRLLRGFAATSDRKLRLLAVSCCRQIWDIIPDGSSRGAVDAAELFADGLISKDELNNFAIAAAVVHSEAFSLKGKVGATAEWAASYAAEPNPVKAAGSALWMSASAARHCSGGTVHLPQADLLRDIFGFIPFRSLTIKPRVLDWKAATVPTIAQGIYADRAFDRLPILADALEDAGCDSADILAHCRGPGPHVRGCWVVDLILGKE